MRLHGTYMRQTLCTNLFTCVFYITHLFIHREQCTSKVPVWDKFLLLITSLCVP